MGKREDDLKHLHGKLRTHEEHLAMLRALVGVYAKSMTLAEVEFQLLNDIDNLEYCLRRDRINNRKPE